MTYANVTVIWIRVNFMLGYELNWVRLDQTPSHLSRQIELR